MHVKRPGFNNAAALISAASFCRKMRMYLHDVTALLHGPEIIAVFIERADAKANKAECSANDEIILSFYIKRFEVEVLFLSTHLTFIVLRR